MSDPEPVGAPPDHANVVVLPPILVGGSFALGLIAHALWPLSIAGRWLRPTGGALLATSVLLAAWSSITLVRFKTALIPHHVTTRIVSTGPFRLSRNPIYVGMLAAFVGGSLLVKSGWPLLLFPAVALVLHHGVVRREEAYLARKFGDEYRRYTETVRRWL